MPGNPFSSSFWGTRGPHEVGIGGEPPRPDCRRSCVATATLTPPQWLPHTPTPLYPFFGHKRAVENCCRFGNLIQIGVLQVATVDRGCSMANPHLDRFKPNQALAVC
ncbi:hypothetical protein Ava_C0136 (plasmid) [Trichormus variabilis ATCC 29413]|uniref:Uncharacterized protein n=1 Tax=Trichormus variabilis (strain ATCC 29413 / PCC 7937) TaxID=240292 RepID=Q3M1B9_TRIV2|nr:hypothetical protein Ava_C0136 [Trichormus variabilis ATCC 29413]